MLLWLNSLRKVIKEDKKDFILSYVGRDCSMVAGNTQQQVEKA